MLECIITETREIESVAYDWGAVKSVANDEPAPGCEQRFGLVCMGRCSASTAVNSCSRQEIRS